MDDYTWISKNADGIDQNSGTYEVGGSFLTFWDESGDEVLILTWTGDALYDEE